MSKKALGSIGRIVAVTSCKGGVGKSTVSYGIAARLAARGHRVGLYDADLHGPSLPSQVPAGNDTGVQPSEDGWSMDPIEHNGMKLMSFGWLRGDDGSPIWGPEAEVDPRYGDSTPGGLVIQLMHTTTWGGLDYLIVDTPPGTGDIPMALAARGHLAGAVVVTTPSQLAKADVVRGVSMLGRFDVPIVGVVENMSSFQCGSCGEEHYPFGKGHLESVLSSIAESCGDTDVPSFRMPIVATDNQVNKDDSPLATVQLDSLAESIEQSTSGKEPVELPQLAWHERPNWENKLYFFGCTSGGAENHGTARRRKIDREYKICAPVVSEKMIFKT